MMVSFFCGFYLYCTSIIVGNALKCQKCTYSSHQPKDLQKCVNNTVECSSGYCYSATYTHSNEIKVFEWDCDTKNYCPNEDETCEEQMKVNHLQACSGSCCTTDNCNNPNSGTGVMAAKFSICLMVILGYFLA